MSEEAKRKTVTATSLKIIQKYEH